MCGIAGVVMRRGAVAAADLQRMAETLRHRGPDDEGYYVSPGSDRGPMCGFGFRRLSIIDVDGGHQPIPNEDESVWVMCNGEIYNFASLRDELERLGHRFRTRSDTEVLVHLWEEDGLRLPARLNGMFALAIWDERTRTLFLARDRLGKKPLYYADLGDTFLFGSEPKSLLAHSACPRDIDRGALSQYLAFEYVPSPLSIFRGVRKLEAGHQLLLKDGRLSVSRYWQPSFEPGARRTDGEWIDELLRRLRESVRIRLVSDVPLGVFLSGGIDSSAVAALMSEILPSSRIKTFSIAFDDESFDESAYARRVARHLGTDHYEQVLTADMMAETLLEVAARLDEPFADGSIVPTYLLSRFTRESVTVALGGDGSDELFAGYPTFQAHRLASLFGVPRPLHRVISRLADRLPVSTNNFSFDFKVKQFLRGAAEAPEIRDQLWLGSFSPEEQVRLLVGPLEDPFAPLRTFASGVTTSRSLERLVAQYLRFYLEGDILVKVDRASMANSLEVRAPFLDHTLVSFVNSMPSNLKLRGLRTKHILRRALRGSLPREILERPKKGFGMPIAKWLKGDLRWLLDEHLSESIVRQQGIFEWQAVEPLVRQHLSGRRDNRKQLWTILMFQLWYANWGG